jgi:hypothetical protein
MNLFKEFECKQVKKYTENTFGDAFLLENNHKTGRAIGILSDGLGSGVKANILANMTATMAMKFTESNMNFLQSAEIIMDALPICQVRKVAYATYTIVDCSYDNKVKIIEQENPPFILLRNCKAVKVEFHEYVSKHKDYRKLRLSEFSIEPDDRIIFFSDGVTESGIGTKAYPLGWRQKGCIDFVEKQVAMHNDISAKDLASKIVQEACTKEPGMKPGDDTSCAVVYFREPRRTILVSGPPFSKNKDYEYGQRTLEFQGKKIVSGGTTAEIISRELKKHITTDLKGMRRCKLPPISKMDGIDLVTEGILTLTEALRILEKKVDYTEQNGATKIVELLLESDIIHFIIGTKINEAHQDPSLPVDLEIRRSLIKHIAKTLEYKYYKQVEVEYI